MSAALSSLAANHSFLPSSASMKSSWRFRFDSTIAASTMFDRPFTIGFAKNGIGVTLMRSKISFSSSGGIAEPSAKCIQ
jgi:hypothetical protein